MDRLRYEAGVFLHGVCDAAHVALDLAVADQATQNGKLSVDMRPIPHPSGVDAAHVRKPLVAHSVC